jgi:secreted trypsin-like serine protease
VVLFVVLAVLAAACGSSSGGRAAAPPTTSTGATPAPTTSGPTTTSARRFELGTVEDVRDGDRSYRYQAAVLDTRVVDGSGRLARTDFDRFVCGGSLVDARHVLTAGHCVIDESRGGAVLPAADLRVVIGRTVLRSEGGVRRRVGAVRVHPRYKRGGKDPTYDVAVLTLAEPVTGIEPVALVRPEDGLTDSSQPVTLTGWGDATSRKKGQEGRAHLRNRMKAVHTAIVVTIDCPAGFISRPLGQDYGLELLLCLRTGDRVGFRSGDSGGPVVAWVGDRPVQVGVVNASAGCADPRYPSIVANLASAPIRSFLRGSLR